MKARWGPFAGPKSKSAPIGRDCFPGTRIEKDAVRSLRDRGFTVQRIAREFPQITVKQIEEALA